MRKTGKVSQSKKVKLALIGAGGMANGVHYPSLVEMKDVDMAAICDLDEAKLKATAEKFQIKRTYSDYRKMLEEVAPDAVYILMPPYHLYDLAIHCLNQKLHVFIEKPPGITREQTYQMASAAERNHCITMVGFQRRHVPAIVKARKMVEKRGPINQCTAYFVKNYLGGGPYYAGATDILTCDAIHAVDELRWMGGDVAKVVSDVQMKYADFHTMFNALLKFENGGVGFLVANWTVGKRIYSVEMHGKGISAFVEPDKQGVVYQDNSEEGLTFTTQEAAGSDKPHHYTGFFAENRHFIDCIKSKKLPTSHLGDSVKTMELVDRIYHSQI